MSELDIPDEQGGGHRDGAAPEVLSSSKKTGKLKREAQKYKDKLAKRGVIYMSRVPPFMKPNKARTLFEKYGEVTRLYLAEEGSCR